MTDSVTGSGGFLIRYRYPGTMNGVPVGTVYVTGPHFGRDVYSHTYRVADAARWATAEEAERMVSRWRHNGGTVVALADAVDLDSP